jgi:diguanylate cyclase (GGDEF)-like protein
MPTSERAIESADERRVRAAWIATPIVVVSFFVLFMLPGIWALALRQVVFMAPLTVAAFSVATIVRIAPKSAELRAWSAMGLCVAALWFSEAYFSAYQVYVSAAGPPAPSASDALNLIGGLCALVAMAIAAGLSRLPRATLFIFVSDLVSTSAILYVSLYALWMGLLATSDTTWQMAARWAGYSFIGIAIVTGVVWLARGSRSSKDRDIVSLLVAALLIFASGLVLWPLWQTGGGTTTPTLLDALTASLILLGYCMMVMAALIRLARADRGWRVTMGRSIDMSRMWQSSLVSGIVLAASAVMGYAAYQLPEGDGERVVLVAGASIAIMALVARTGFATYETGTLRDTSAIDPISGALNHRAFQDECDERILVCRRRGTPFVLAVLDLDGFSRVNSQLGHAEGDSALRDVVVALQSAAGRSANVFRLSGDEFAVVGTGVTTSGSMPFASGLLAAVREVEPTPGLTLSASIGVVACGTCDETKEELLRRADAAQVWAKYHGKGRAVAYDEQIVRALGVEERLRLDEEQSFIGVARALAAAADARDARNYYHARNVASLAVLLAEESGLSPQHARLIEIASILHDVGRIAMPDPVMPSFKRGQRQSRADEEHSALGAQLVGSLGIDSLPLWVRAHHERWDGSGFPDGLAGEDIPLEARIIALADAYDGMTAGRRGGSSMSKSAALQEIDHGIGNRFDPVLAERFIEVVGRTASLGWSDEWPAA